MSRNIFVFGSNTAGIHGAGAAAFAVKNHGAVYRQGIGLQGNAYGIPTKDRCIRTLPLSAIDNYVTDFIDFAVLHPELTFNVPRIGCGLAGYTDEQIAPMFKTAPNNVNLPIEWEPIIGKGQYHFIDWVFKE